MPVDVRGDRGRLATSSHVRDLLRTCQVVTIGEVLHSLIPALLVAEVRQLFQQYAAVLAGDRGDLAVRRPTAIGTVTACASGEQVRTVFEIGLQERALCELLVARGTCRWRLCHGDTDGCEQGEREGDECRTHAATVTMLMLPSDQGNYVCDSGLRVVRATHAVPPAGRVDSSRETESIHGVPAVLAGLRSGECDRSRR